MSVIAVIQEYSKAGLQQMEKWKTEGAGNSDIQIYSKRFSRDLVDIMWAEKKE